MNDYCQDTLGSAVTEKLQAAAFRQLVQHLQDRSDVVSNMDMMALTGFCRNCLAKWMVVGARKLVDNENMCSDELLPVQALNSFGYDEAAQHVYGMGYPEWKKLHMKKATAEQMERFEASKPRHAQHDKALLEKRHEQPQPTPTGQRPLASNVCCQEPPPPAPPSSSSSRMARTLPPYQAPPLPSFANPLRFGVLTVSDRASRDEYSTGDLSGPAVAQAIAAMLPTTPTSHITTAIVPDDAVAIQECLQSWTSFDCIFTTGGTGFGPRDVTPEAVQKLLNVELTHVMPFIATECARRYNQPLSSLSRGVAGIRGGTTLVATLPGNPKAVQEIMPLLLPLLLHAVERLKEETKEQ